MILPHISIATWNLLGDDFEPLNRLKTVASHLDNVDVCSLQEVVALNELTENSATVLASLARMELASLADGELENQVSKKFQSTAIITRLPIIQKNIFFEVPDTSIHGSNSEPKRYAGALLKSKSGRFILIVSLHLPWGGTREHRRLAHVISVSQAIDSFMLDLPKDSMAIIAGDFNTVPQADTLRYLKGELGAANLGSYWIDAWDLERDGRGETFDPKSKNINISRTATLSGIQKFDLMPPRRIDYILVRGWSYGRPGSPLGSQLIGVSPGEDGLHASDHYGIRSKFWDPS